jgi:hypothetical protein
MSKAVERVAAVEERSALMGFLFHCAGGDDNLSFMAKRLTIAIHTGAMPAELVERLAAQSPGRIMRLLRSMEEADVLLPYVPKFVERDLSSPTTFDVLRSRRNLHWNDVQSVA